MISTSTCDGWGHCPQGVLRKLAAELTARKLRHLWMTRLAIGVTSVLIMIAGMATADAVYTWRVATGIPGRCTKCQPLQSQTPAPPTDLPSCPK